MPKKDFANLLKPKRNLDVKNKSFFQKKMWRIIFCQKALKEIGESTWKIKVMQVGAISQQMAGDSIA